MWLWFCVQEWSYRSQRSRSQECCFLLRFLGENRFLPLVNGCPHLLGYDPSLCLQNQHDGTSLAFFCFTYFVWIQPGTFLRWESPISSSSTRGAKQESSSRPLLLSNITSSQVYKWRCGIIWEFIILPSMPWVPLSNMTWENDFLKIR